MKTRLIINFLKTRRNWVNNMVGWVFYLFKFNLYKNCLGLAKNNKNIQDSNVLFLISLCKERSLKTSVATTDGATVVVTLLLL